MLCLGLFCFWEWDLHPVASMHKNTTLWKSFWQGPDIRTMQKVCASPKEQPPLGELRQAHLTRHVFSEFRRLSDSQTEKALPSRSRGLQEHHWTDSQDPFFWGCRKDSPSQLTFLVEGLHLLLWNFRKEDRDSHGSYCQVQDPKLTSTSKGTGLPFTSSKIPF